MARGPEGSVVPRLSKEELLAQVRQERDQKAKSRAEAKDVKTAEKQERAKEGKEKREKFYKDVMKGVDTTWKGVKELGPKASKFVNEKATLGQDMLDSLAAGHRYKQQEKAVAKDTRERALASVQQAEVAMKEHKRDAKKHTEEIKKREWDKKVTATKEAWKGKVTTAKEWGMDRLTDVINKGRDAKHKHWDVPVNNFKVKRVDSKLAKEQKTLRTEIGMNMDEITLLMNRVNEIKTHNKGLGEQLKFLSDKGVERGSADTVIGTADLSRKAEWMTQGKTDLETLFTMRSATYQ